VENGSPLHRAPTGEIGACSFAWTLRDCLRRALETEHLSLSGRSVRGTRRRAFLLLGTLKVMYNKVLEKDVFLHKVLIGNHGGEAPLPGL
jgi:hypothetical protein